MIGKLRGVVDSFGDDFVILDVAGVGYVVNCSSRTLQHLPRAGEPATLAIETQVREDSIRLFGFSQRRRARLVSPAAERAGRRRQGRAGDFVDPAAGRTGQRHSDAGQGDGLARARASGQSSRRASSPN